MLGILILALCGCTTRTGERKTVIRYCQWSGQRHQPVVWKLKEEFEKEHPDIEVKLEFYSRGYWSKLLTEIVGGVAPDVIYLSAPYVQEFVRKGLLVNLEPLIERDGLDMSDFYDVVTDTFRVDGKLYGLPIQFGCIALYYNKTLFDKAGEEYPDWSWDWNRLLDAAKRLTRDTDGDGKIDQYGFLVSTSAELYTANFIWQNGGRMISDDRRRTLIDSPEAGEAIQFLVDCVMKYRVSPRVDIGDVAGMDAVQLFETGRVAMAYDGSWKMEFYNEHEGLNYDVAPLPKGKRRAVAVNGLANGINARTAHLEEAWEWVKFYVSPKAQRILAEMKRGIPIRLSVARSESFLDKRTPPKNKKVFLDQLPYGHDLYPTLAWMEWNEIYRREMDYIFRGMKTVEEGLYDAAVQINEILKRAYEESER